MTVLIDVGCAECYHPGVDDEPLAVAVVYESVEAAKAEVAKLSWLEDSDWKPHPQGGEHIIHGQGTFWIMPEPDAIVELGEPS